MADAPHDPVNHPRHYTQGGIECIDAIEAALGPAGFTAFLQGQVVKYTWRLGRKDAAEQDAAKARWYADRLVKHLAKETAFVSKDSPPALRHVAAHGCTLRTSPLTGVLGVDPCALHKLQPHASPATRFDAS